MKRALLTLAALFTFVVIQFLAPAWLTTSYAASSCSTKNGSGSGVVNATTSVSVHRGDKVTATAANGTPGGMLVLIFYPGGGFVSGYDSASGTASSTGTATVEVDAVRAPPSFTWQVTVCLPGSSASTSTSSSHPACPIYTDGRLNDCTPWETSAVYCLADGSVRIYVPAKPL